MKSIAIGLVALTSIFISTLNVAPAVAATTNQCENVFAASAAKSQSTSLTHEMAALGARRYAGVTARGFISAFPAVSGAASEAASEHGLGWWAMRIYVAKTAADAEAHWRSIKDPLIKGVYLLDPNSAIDLKTANGPDTFQALYKNAGLIEFQPKAGAADELTASRVPEDFVRQNMDPKSILLMTMEETPFMTQPGWVYTKIRGVVLAEDTVGSTTYKNMRTLARKLYRDGWRVTFNKDFVQSLNMVRDQKRFSEGKWVANSRYLLDKNLYDATIENFKKGSAISVELWDAHGKLAGSVIADVNGLLYNPESVGYDQATYPKYSLDLAKIPFIALQERLEEVGIKLIDNGMVTDFTASLRGKYIERQVFDELVQELKGRVNPVSPDLTTPYTPRGL